MWECGDCGHAETVKRPIDGVCHHCGLLLCGECRVELIDGAFGGPLVSAERTALHCRACRRTYHPVSAALRRDRGG